MRHAHMQIEYTNKDKEQVESLVGFDPRKEEDKKFVHDCLDEYLRYLAERWEKDGSLHECNHFEISDEIHD